MSVIANYEDIGLELINRDLKDVGNMDTYVSSKHRFEKRKTTELEK
jgi:hypothetical protein